MSRVLAVVSLIAFATALFTRAVEPIVSLIAGDLGVEPAKVALLSSAFALPFALVQPILGPVGDMVGKPRVMVACLAVLVVSGFVGAFATSFAVLLVTRIVAGMASGGIFPVAVAIIGDLVPVQQRQVALGRYLALVISGGLVGTLLAGIVGDLVGWRAVFGVIGGCGALAFGAALSGLRGVPDAAPGRLDLRSVPAGYRAIFANPRAKVCYVAVFLEGVTVFGLFPFVALLLLQRGEARASIAGLVLAGFAAGGFAYALAVRLLLLRLTPSRIMIAGGASAAAALIGCAFQPWWPVELAIFAVLGFGFYMLHGSIQVHATEIAPNARGAAIALNSFAFFIGHAAGPVVYAAGFAQLGTALTLVLAAALVLFVAAACARLLSEQGGAV